jgi:hypothetical protein
MPFDAADAAAIAWLERFQEQQFQRYGLPLPKVITLDDALRVMGERGSRGVDPVQLEEEVRKTFGRGDTAPGSRYDGPFIRGHLTEMGSELQKFMGPELKFTMPIFGTCPLASPNAMCVLHEPSGRHIVVFHQGYFDYFGEMIRAFVHACPGRRRFRGCTTEELVFDGYTEGRADESYRAHGWVLAAVVSALTGQQGQARALVSSMFEKGALIYKLSKEEEEMAVAIQNCLMAFVVGHEFGHIIANQVFVEHGSFVRDPALNPKETINTLRSLNEEIVADRSGVILANRRNGAQGFGPEESYAGILLFFSLARFLDCCLAVLRDGKVPDEETSQSLPGPGEPALTHPPLLIRKTTAEEMLERENKVALWTDRGKALSRSFGACLGTQFNLAEKTLLFWHNKGAAEMLAPEYRRA